MSHKLKCYQNWYITKTDMLSKLTYHENQNIAKTEKYKNWNTTQNLKLNCNKNWNVTYTEMSPKLKCYQNWNVIKLKCHKNWNVTKTEMSPKLKCHQNWNIIKKHFWFYVKAGNSQKQKHILLSASKWKLSASKKIKKVMHKYGLHRYLRKAQHDVQSLWWIVKSFFFLWEL